MGDERQHPHLYRVGMYAFFAWLAFWSAMPIYALAKWVDLSAQAVSVASNIAVVATFLALRDMTKNAFPKAPARDEVQG